MGSLTPSASQRRCVLVGGARISRYDRIRDLLREGDFYIFCDCGLDHLAGLGVTPDLAVGDFDSYSGPRPETEVILLPREKDDTDLLFAAREAVSRGFTDFLLLGAFGGRLDHTLGNLAVLMFLDTEGKTAQAVTDYEILQVVSRQSAFVDPEFSYFSVLSLEPRSQGVCIRDAEYPLENAELTSEYPLGISNRTLPGRTAEVSVEQGRLLLMKGLTPLPGG
ncbi:MAG: thiamine diphosphokinase [Oscillospiraceae bacterium]|nr:thiamine diphosphokinase [Oscillospiraceae bacterium]